MNPKNEWIAPLPPLFPTPITHEQWPARQKELLALFEENIYGRRPDTPFTTTWKIRARDNKALAGQATLKLVDITITSGQRSLTFCLRLFTPNQTQQPVPTFLLICNRSRRNIDYTRRIKSEFWPVEEIIANGFGAAAFFNGEIDPDVHDGFRNGIHRVLDRGLRDYAAWGTISAWAFGASRAMDYLEHDPQVDASRVAVIGHSRGGKTALWAGATDPRFALAISNNSGCTGASPARRRVGETVKQINDRFPHWFCTNYIQYNFCEDKLPVDQHMLIALMAPRAVYVASASEDLWADPVGEFIATREAQQAWELFGYDPILPESPPPIEQPVHGQRIGYHIRKGGHGLRLYDWQQYLRFAKQLFSA